MSDQERVKYEPGHALTTWSEEKFARAMQHLADLRSQIHIWSARARVDRECVISEDQTRLDVLLRIAHRPPVSHWSLILGDYLHNLRSALDAVVWELANLDGASPASPHRVQFPVAMHSTDWDKLAGKDLATIPSVALERIKLTQPFNAEDPKTSPIYLLHRLDIQDKHRSLLEFKFKVQSIKTDGLKAKLAEDNIPLAPPSIDIAGDALDDGERLLSIQFNQRITEAEAPIEMSFEGTLDFEGRSYQLENLLNQLGDQVRVALSLIKYGTEDNPELERVPGGLSGQEDNLAGTFSN